jgi:ribonucleoside-diphosphate reductase beta chain
MDQINTKNQFSDANTSNTNLNQDQLSSIKMKDDIQKLVADTFTEENTNEEQLKMFIKKLASKYGYSKINEGLNRLSDKDLQEPLLNPKNHKYTAFPIKYDSIWKTYKQQLAAMWKEEEIDFSNDYQDYLSLNKNEQHFVEMILAFFAASDGIVNFNLSERFTREIQVTEALFAYQFQIMMENIHSTSYSIMLDEIVKEQKKKEHLFNAIETIPAVKMMADYAFKWIESSESFAHRVVAFSIIEGIFFSGAFAAIFWLKKYKNKSTQSGKPFMNGLVESNRLISRDEGMHTEYAFLLYSLLVNKLSINEVNTMIREAVDIAKNFMTVSLPVSLINMNNKLMCDYIEYVADGHLINLGYKKIFNTKNPFEFMKTIGQTNKSNFFELRENSYQDANIMNKSKGKRKIIIDEDF